MYVGGTGSPSHNFHRDAMARGSFTEEATRIAELWHAGRREEAIATVPDVYLEAHALLGSSRRIRQGREAGFVPAGVTGLIVGASRAEEVDLIAALAGLEPEANGVLR